MQHTISLLRPSSSALVADTEPVLSVLALNDLELDKLCARLAHDNDQAAILTGILARIPRDAEVIAYRQAVFDEICRSEGLADSFNDILRHLRNLEYLTKTASTPEELDLWRLFSRFKELGAYVDCIEAIYSRLDAARVKSEGLVALLSNVGAIRSGDEFSMLREAVCSFDIEIDKIRALSIGINLDSSLNPVEVKLLSIEEKPYKENPLKAFMQRQITGKTGSFGLDEDLGVRSSTKILSSGRRHSVMSHLHNDIAFFLRHIIKDADRALTRLAHIRGGHLIALIPEIEFYLCFAKLRRTLEGAGLPCCLPRTAKNGAAIKGLYNIGLALDMLGRGDAPGSLIVPNDAFFDEECRVMILTGPNRGGKTVYTVALGAAQVLYQTGVCVPAVSAEITPADCVFTHFPELESKTGDLGRLGEEAGRMCAIFERATRYSLILLNESLANTSAMEGMFIALDVVRAFRSSGRALFSTRTCTSWPSAPKRRPIVVLTVLSA